jgi:hypothetical protein
VEGIIGEKALLLNEIRVYLFARVGWMAGTRNGIFGAIVGRRELNLQGLLDFQQIQGVFNTCGDEPRQIGFNLSSRAG